MGLLAGAVSAATLGYLGYVAVTWYRYGRTDSRCASDPLLDRFFPRYEVRECHEKHVQAPAAVTLATAQQISLRRSPVVRGIFELRSIPSRLRGTPQRNDERGILEETRSLGWGVLAEAPGREIVMGAVTQPWKADVVFSALPPEEFAAFAQPGYVKIAWTLSAEPVGPSSCIFRTETRVIAMDDESRSRFRRYWSFLSPGILVIRHEILRLIKKEAEGQYPLRQPSRA